jgi:hypothetical protein
MKYLFQARLPAIHPLKPNAPRSKIQSDIPAFLGSACFGVSGCAVLLDEGL